MAHRVPKRLGIVALLIGLGAAWSVRADEPIAVIVSSRWTEIEEISLITLQRVYLGRILRLSGHRLECFHLQAGSAVRAGFSLAVLGRSEAALREYWLEQALTGGSVPPREFGSASKVVAQVARRRGAIGYVAYRELQELDRRGIRVLGILEGGHRWLPTQPSYPIRYP